MSQFFPIIIITPYQENKANHCFIFFSTLFLVGPLKQLRNMFKEKRLIATIVMLVSDQWKKKIKFLIVYF